MTVGEGEWQLPGTLAVPNGSGTFPAALLVAGFWTPRPRRHQRRHQGFPRPQRRAGLARHRGAALRKTHARSTLPAWRASSYTADDETIDDALTALHRLRAQPEVDGRHVFLVGHDLGGYLAPEIAQDDEKLAGVVIMGANVRPLEDVMVEMLQAMQSMQIAGLAPKDQEAAKGQPPRNSSPPRRQWRG